MSVNKLRILHIIPNLRKGGAERLVLNICAELQNREGIEVQLMVFEEGNDYQFLSGNIDILHTPISINPSFLKSVEADVENLQKAIDDFQPKVIHAHLFQSIWALSFIQYSKALYVTHVHDNMVQLNRLSLRNGINKVALTNWKEKQIVDKAYSKRRHKFLCISKDTESFIQQNMVNAEAKLLLNAIDLERFRFQEKTGKENSIVMIGSLVQKKGHDLAIDTMSHLIKLWPDAKLHVLGKGPLEADLKKQCETLNLQEAVIFEGNVDHPEKWLQVAKMFLHTASYEPFGLVLVEAMATGTPVVSTDGMGNRDLMNGKNGLFIEHRNPEQLAEEILLFFRNHENVQSCISEGRKTAEIHGMANYCDELLNFYRS